MKRLAQAGGLVLAVAMVAGCSSSAPEGPRVVTAATPERLRVLWEPVMGLAGEWEMLDDKGVKSPALSVRVTSGGSVVHEVMFPGANHEMTNVYHMDGSDLVMTHYCAFGNQPTMRATAVKNGEIAFAFDGVTNLRAADETYMGTMTLVIRDKDHMEQTWTSFKAGKAEPPITFKFEKKK